MNIQYYDLPPPPVLTFSAEDHNCLNIGGPKLCRENPFLVCAQIRTIPKLFEYHAEKITRRLIFWENWCSLSHRSGIRYTHC